LAFFWRFCAAPLWSVAMFARSPWVRRLVAAAATTALAWAMGGSSVALAASPYLEVPPREEVESAPAFRYANMTNEEALAELDRRGVPHARLEAVPGVRAPIRFTGPLHGVDIHSSLPPEERASSPFEILDARLALALDDYAVILARHDVVELVHYTMYRPNVPPPGSPSARIALGSKPHGTKPSGSKPQAASPPTGRQPPAKPESAKPSDAPPPAPVAKEPPPRTAKAKAKRRAELAPKATRDDKATRARSIHRERAGTKGKELEPTIAEFACAHDHAGEVELDAVVEEGGSSSAKAPSPTRTSKPTATPPNPAARGPKKPAKRRVMLVSNERPHGTWAPPGTRHPAGLAIDLGSVRKSDGSILSISQHFRGKIGDKTCGADVADPETPEARELRALVCEARDAGIFTYALTPNFDAPHVDHFHLEIKPGVAWFLYH